MEATGMTMRPHSDAHEGHDQHAPAPASGSWLRSRTGAAFVGFLVIAGFFLITEHTAHVFGALPFLFLLACPFLHLFMHGGHGGDADSHAGHGGQQR